MSGDQISLSPGWTTRRAGTVCRVLHRPGALGRGLLALLGRGAARAVRASGARRPAWIECANKLRVLRCFEDPASALDPLPDAASLPELVESAYLRVPEDAVWVTEGLACLFADRWSAGDPTSARRALGRLPAAARIPAHAGVGLSIAWRRLEELRREPAPAATRRCLERCVREAEEQSLEGFVETVVESLGFAARLLFPSQISRIVPHLEDVDGRLPSCFWHGLGRALYFTPVSFLPRADSAWRAIRRARSEVPDPRAGDRALEGFAWPFLMVNVRTPEVVAAVLERHGELVESAPFRRGLETAIGVWQRSTARSEDLIELRCFEPRSRDPQAVERWIHQVREPCERWLEEER